MHRVGRRSSTALHRPARSAKPNLPPSNIRKCATYAANIPLAPPPRAQFAPARLWAFASTSARPIPVAPARRIGGNPFPPSAAAVANVPPPKRPPRWRARRARSPNVAWARVRCVDATSLSLPPPSPPNFTHRLKIIPRQHPVFQVLDGRDASSNLEEPSRQESVVSRIRLVKHGPISPTLQPSHLSQVTTFGCSRRPLQSLKANRAREDEESQTTSTGEGYFVYRLSTPLVITIVSLR
ncbi:hypothetical protein BD410DRAFT_808489 [Rickenella mellea]|uniref:Uncharacterized protein n=1 Tax=Rickenella mellea TaxID=50990 RepID=A0A4Y7PLK5_9AGAM|nr:hypothetical protein BD410DRAFT_808489 [Rickenella mellea]